MEVIGVMKLLLTIYTILRFEGKGLQQEVGIIANPIHIYSDLRKKGSAELEIIANYIY
jgi:hypothetical protein